MAILVRGGREPPEKKWDLYKQFYDVMRTREASKNFSDPTLSRILKQDTALLKSVHNRLGFLLHSRAETAEGAQASLDRKSFEELVAELALERKESKDVDSTTQALVTATEQRLVLISTPDDGARVRFDIRQLQEFFAAEFLYDGATADQLRSRLQLITGDSHWQEVVHFLLSALIEQNRKAELHVALGILNLIDAGGNNPDTIELTELLASGACAVARLIEDGILEEDKAFRSLFSDKLRLLARARSPDPIHPLTSIRGPTTRDWVKELFYRHILRSSPSGASGALHWMWLELKDGEAEVSTLQEYLKKTPPEAAHLILSPPILRRAKRTMED